MATTLNYFIENGIKDIILNSKNPNIYRDPLIGFTNADNPLFHKLKAVVVSDHLLPCDLIQDARSVVSFFIPFKEDLIEINVILDVVK